MKELKGKARYDLLPPEALIALTEVIEYGAMKYKARDWEKGNDFSLYFAATQRHLWRFWQGEDIDTESGMNHLKHALTNIAFLITWMERGKGNDDRPGTAS